MQKMRSYRDNHCGEPYLRPSSYPKGEKKKPELTDSEILEWIKCAKKKLWKDEYLTNDIKKELEIWDNVD